MARPSKRIAHLPAEATSFVGRRRELAELRSRLSEARVVSLVGPGGVGKTRLAMRGAADLARGFPGGAWWVELAEVLDPALVDNAVVAALDLRDQSAAEPRALLIAHLRERRLLLVLDNCEHVLEAVATLVAEVVRAAPEVRVLATSREPLSVPGEQVIAIPPLELPPPGAGEPAARLRQNEAVTLFTERASAASGSFELTGANQAAVVELCRRLDGLPLAIELAAVRTRVLSAQQILDRLSDRFGLLTGGSRGALPRHQTLRTTIDWSYDLLDESERALLRRLCVFAGRFTIEDAGAVCDSNALDLLSSLVDKSLVMKEETSGAAVYRLHETMREYARLRLREAGEEAAVEEECVQYYWSTCLQSRPGARYRLPEWLEWIDLEVDNVRAVLLRCVQNGDLGRATDLVTAIGWYWITRATTEGVRWLDQVLASPQHEAQTLAWAYFMRGFLAVLQGDPAVARPVLERAVTEARRTAQANALSHSLAMASIAANMAGDREAGLTLLAEAATVTAEMDDVDARVGVLQARALSAIFSGDLEEMQAASVEGERLSRATGDLYSLGMMLLNLGFASFSSGDLVAAKPLFIEALGIADRIDDRSAQYALLDALGCVAARSRQPRLAAQLLGAAETVRAGTGAAVIGYLEPLLAQAEQSARAALGPARFDAEFAAGEGMGRSAAIRLALGTPSRAVPAAANGARDAPLGKRQTEVARLVAEGMSNKQIGARLFISERTVDSHVRGILNKLGFNSRAQIAAWVATDR